MCNITEEAFAEGFAEGFVDGFNEGFEQSLVQGCEEWHRKGFKDLAKGIALSLAERGISVESIALAVSQSVPTVESWIKESGASAVNQNVSMVEGRMKDSTESKKPASL